jgi:cysteine dioxygenase
MTLFERIKKILDGLAAPSALELRDALESLGIGYEELVPFLQTPGGHPYYRRLLYQNEEVELLMMNWSDIECSPHDHGHSKGWIQVMEGNSLNTVYEVENGQLPRQLFNGIHRKGSFFFAPKKGVHKMKREGQDSLVTLHLYSPPIEGMKVYDLKKCAACIVSKECGAWWPEHQKQKLKEITFERE